MKNGIETETWFDQRPSHSVIPERVINLKEQSEKLWIVASDITDKYVLGQATLGDMAAANAKAMEADYEYRSAVREWRK